MPKLHLSTLYATLLLSSTALETDPNLKYKFFCGSSFADIQLDTCASRQWCPSSSDDECLLPGQTCFANTPCDARTIENVQVPTYSLSMNPAYNTPQDKMFCGTTYSEALATCQAGGDTAIGRHCPDESCPDGQFCFIDMPCSYFVLTDPSANPLSNVNELEISEEELELPDPGTMESYYFCGPTFQQAAADCSSKTWCRTGTNQECPNGETCFVSVNNENPSCEINAIVKKEYEEAQLLADNNINQEPTSKPTNSPLSDTDERNMQFCGMDWNDASNNCFIERHCPNGDKDCISPMTCQTYTQCSAVGMTGSPTPEPTPVPTSELVFC
jgi:hypothetical protein